VYGFETSNSTSKSTHTGATSATTTMASATAISVVDVTVPCVPHEVYIMSVLEYSAAHGTLINRTWGKALCMYMRREFRTMLPADMSTVMDAMQLLWTTEEEHGQSLYGPDFHNATYFGYAHFFQASMPDSDHYHNGAGFLPQHIQLTNAFEKSMQAVDPSVSLPYWDCTIEAALNIPIWDSPLFQPETFGSLVRPPDMKW
jgi:Common central domain of tyrosinase